VLESSQGKEIGRQQLTTNAFGSFCGTFVLPREVLNGRFYLRVPSETRKIIRVEAYKRPKFEIVFHPVDYTYRLGDSITLTGEVKNYSGFPLANTKMAYRIQAEAWKYKQLVDQGELQTDETGRFRILVPTERVAGHASLAYNVQMTFTAPNGETQEHSYSLPVQNDAFYLGLRLKAIVNKAKPAQFPFSAFNAQHLPVRQTVRYKIERLKTPEQLVSGHIYPAQFTEKEVQACILQGQFTTGDSLLELDLSAYPSGIYLFTVQGASPRDSLIRRRNVFTLYSPGDARPPYPTYSWFVEEKTTFAPGEPAKLLLGTSAQVVNVLYEIYANNQFVHRERFTLSDENRILQIPYQAHYGSNAEVILTYVKDQQFFVHTATLERKKEESSLRLFTRTFRDRLQPGQRETWSLTLQKANGEAVFGEVMAGMYDASLDQLYMPNRWELYSFRSSFNRIPRWFHPRKSEEYQRSHFPIFNKLPVYPIRTQWDDFRLQRRLDFYFGEGTTFTAAAVRIPSSKSMATDEDEMYCLNERAFAVEGMADRAPAERTTGIRKNFQETAFFYPQLLTDEAGEVRFSFTMPDVNTTWRFMSLAHTPELQQGRLEKMVVTSKPFMISSQLPRFVRMDDQVTLQATLQNLSMETQTGTVYFELFDPYTEKVTHREQLPFHAPAKGAETVRFSFTVPKGETLLGCRFVARSRQFSDGEQHVLPVAPNTVLVTRTLPLFLTKPGQESFTLSAPKWATPYRFTLELTANPTWYAVLALPSLSTPQSEHGTDQLAAYYVSHLAQAIVTANPQISDLIRYGLAQSEDSPVSPLSQNEELKSTLLQLTPWAMEAENETAQLQALGELLDTNRQTYLQQQALQKLQALQNADGGWSWFKGCSSSRFITFNVLEMFSRLTVTAHITLPVEVKGMQQRALRYIDEEIRADFERNTAGGYLQLLYLHTRSAYSDTLTGETKKVYDYYFKLFEAHWPELSLYEKALLAVVCHRSGKKETAQAILQSLREYATTTAAEGMFWANNRSRFYTYSTLQTHTAILNAFYEIEGSSEKIRRMKQWLLRQKQTHMWESVPVTVEAIFALMRTGETTLNTPDSCTVRVNRKRLAPSRMLPSLGYFKQGYMGKALPTRAPRVTIRKTTDQLSWGGLYLQYFEHLDSIRQHTGGLSVEKQLFVEREGNFFPLHTSQGQRNLKVGDKVNIRLVVTAPEAMQFVHLKDLRAGCFEPTNQLSGNRWQGSVLYYQETDDTVTNLFFEYLPKGTHVFEYTVWITQSGDYQDGIATLQCIYAPQFSANSQAGRIKVE